MPSSPSVSRRHDTQAATELAPQNTGQAQVRNARHAGGHLSQLGNMKLWHRDTYVCDPWCNIACRAKDYPKQFIDKMEKWENRGKLVGYPPTGFVHPTEPEWIRDVLRGGRTVSNPFESQSS